ncbi:MAG TPA: hypothetical protein V6D06_14865 [Trichocoleus sp.]
MTPGTFRELPISLPPMLLQMARVTGEGRFISLYYWGSKATWDSGRGAATFSFYGVWSPLIEHLALACHLWDCHLGSDDAYPTHALIADRQEQKLYVADWDEAQRFVEDQHPPLPELTAEQEAEALASLVQVPIGSNGRPQFEELQRLGLFEVLMPLSPLLQQESAELTAWLDQFVADELLEHYRALARQGHSRAGWYLQLHAQRARA